MAVVRDRDNNYVRFRRPATPASVQNVLCCFGVRCQTSVVPTHKNVRFPLLFPSFWLANDQNSDPIKKSWDIFTVYLHHVRGATQIHLPVPAYPTFLCLSSIAISIALLESFHIKYYVEWNRSWWWRWPEWYHATCLENKNKKLTSLFPPSPFFKNSFQVWPYNIQSTTWPTCRCWDHAWGRSTIRPRCSVRRNYLSLWTVNQIIITHHNVRFTTQFAFACRAHFTTTQSNPKWKTHPPLSKW